MEPSPAAESAAPFSALEGVLESLPVQSLHLRGVAASPGCVEGVAFVYRLPGLDAVPRYRICGESIERELVRFERALKRSAGEIQAVRARVAREVGEAEAGIFAAHPLFLEDTHFVERICGRIRGELVNVEQALAEEIRISSQSLAACQSEYMRERSLDLRDVGNRLVRNLVNHDGVSLLESLPRETILVAEELMPSDTIAMDRQHVAGLVLENGGATSHAAILARSLGIPAVTGLHGVMGRIQPGMRVLLDGFKGLVVVNPSAAQARRFARQRRHCELDRRLVDAETHHECALKDGLRITLQANIGRLEDLSLVREHRLDGIGLLRTELLYIKHQKAPALPVQCRDYERAASLEPLPVAVRTFDFSPDKCPAFLDARTEMSVLKGLRGLRFTLQERRLLKVQLRALARVCRRHPNLHIVFPMVVGRQCLSDALELLDAQCRAEGLEKRPPVGAMIETPAAVFSARDIIGMVDFVNIGSNDLAQYVLAEDRCLTDMQGYELILHPAMLRAVQAIAGAAAERACPLALCGEAAGDALLAAVMVGLGVRAFSVSPVRAHGVRYGLRRVTLEETRGLAGLALEMADPVAFIHEAQRRFPAAFPGPVTGVGAHTPPRAAAGATSPSPSREGRRVSGCGV